MLIREYSTQDRLSCLQILRGNTPRFFAPSDEIEFAHFLDHLPGQYWIAEVDKEILACGGVALERGARTATLCWGIVAARAQGRGIGSALLEYRLTRIATEFPGVRRVRLTTTQIVQSFFERHGFQQLAVDRAWYGPALDRVHMERSVNL